MAAIHRVNIRVLFVETVFESLSSQYGFGDNSVSALIVDFIIHPRLQFLTVKQLHSKQNDINDIYGYYLNSIVLVRKHVRRWRGLFSKWRQELNNVGFAASLTCDNIDYNDDNDIRAQHHYDSICIFETMFINAIMKASRFIFQHRFAILNIDDIQDYKTKIKENKSREIQSVENEIYRDNIFKIYWYLYNSKLVLNDIAKEMHFYLPNSDKDKSVTNVNVIQHIKGKYSQSIESKIDYKDLYMIDSLIELTLIYIWYLRDNVKIVETLWNENEEAKFQNELNKIVDNFVSKKCIASTLHKYWQYLHRVSL